MALQPNTGLDTGGYVVSVLGVNFLGSKVYTCAFVSTVMPGKFISTTQVIAFVGGLLVTVVVAGCIGFIWVGR